MGEDFNQTADGLVHVRPPPHPRYPHHVEKFKWSDLVLPSAFTLLSSLESCVVSPPYPSAPPPLGEKLLPGRTCRVPRGIFAPWSIPGPRTRNCHFIINGVWNEWMSEGEHECPGLCILALLQRRATWLFTHCPPPLDPRVGSSHGNQVVLASRFLPAWAAAARGSCG